MPVDFNTPFPEPSSLVGFSQNKLVRDAEKRDASCLPSAMASEAAGYHLFCGAAVIVRKDDTPTATFTREEADGFSPDYSKAIMLGESENGPRIAVPVGIDTASLEEPWKVYDFRALLYSSSVTEEETGAIAQGGSILHWHDTNRFCGRCGGRTVSEIGGYRIGCTECDHKIFPRTDPVAIMLAVRGNKCLLGRSPHFPEGWYSTLAGFVEPGETIEDAVRRETFEESGVRIGRVQYHASQPWPFPHSLMIGVHCEAISEDIQMDESELEDCRWFTREETRLMIRDEHPDGVRCPPSRAIASALIRAWAED